MSSHSALPLRLAPRARQDFIDILHYTGVTWGRLQLVSYRDQLNAGLQAIQSNPRIGHGRSDLPPNHLAYPVGSHIIIYRVGVDHIGVVRILHQRMSPARHL